MAGKLLPPGTVSHHLSPGGLRCPALTRIPPPPPLSLLGRGLSWDRLWTLHVLQDLDRECS